MRISCRTRVVFALVLLMQAAIVTSSLGADELLKGFTQPPKQARPSIYWLWLNGYVNRDHFEKELTAYKEKGISGLLIFEMGARGPEGTIPEAGPPFFSGEFVDSVAHALEVAGKLDMDVQLATSSSWDMGGAWVEPHQASMRLYRSSMTVRGPSAFNGAVPMPEIAKDAPRGPDGKLLFMKNVAVLAVPAGPPGAIISDLSEVVNLTEKLSDDGVLDWNVPAGQWDILRFVCANTGERLKVPSPQSDGLATDHLSREATRTYVEYLTSRLKAKLGDLRSTALKQLYLASYEPEPEIWTPDFDVQFRKYKGYDIIPFLPVLSGYILKDAETTQRFLYDYRKALGELMIDAYYRQASRSAREAGLGVEAEAGGPGTPLYQIPIDALKAQGAIDEVRGEFWPWREQRDNIWVVKETACAAHIYGKRRVHMESFTSMVHWENGPFDLKPAADRAFCEGMNHVVWHTASHQPPEAGEPGWVYHAGTHIGQNLIWWPKSKPFLDYLSRCSFMLQQGLFVADVCYYYGDQAFNFVPPKHVDPSLGPGYDYDVCNPEVILTRMDVEDGRIRLPDGMQYELLVLPDREDIDLAVLEKIGQLVAKGATAVGPKPLRSNGLHNFEKRDRQIAALAGRIWGDCDGKTITRNRYGKGSVIWGETLRSILEQRGLSVDFSWESADKDAALDYIHRRTRSGDLYFVRNKQNKAVEIRAYFRVPGKRPERWDPASGRISAFENYRHTRRGTQVSLSLAPYGSMFVVFRDNATELPEAPKPAERLTMRVAGPWEVRFPDGRGAPRSVRMDELQSWTKHKNPGVRFYSGTARYKTEISISKRMLSGESPLILDLGALWAVGEVFLNGNPLGILWKPPYELDVKPFAKAGVNTLEIEVCNTWANRLAGDAAQTGGKQYAKTNVTGSGTNRKLWKDMPLRPSGLFGPVTLNWK